MHGIVKTGAKENGMRYKTIETASHAAIAAFTVMNKITDPKSQIYQYTNAELIDVADHLYFCDLLMNWPMARRHQDDRTEL